MLAAVAVVVLMWFTQLPSHRPWIPQEPPREEWRVVHPNGFSIICPPGWSVRIVTNPPIFFWHKDDAVRLRSIDSISLRTRAKRVRFAPSILVADLWESAPINLWAYPETVFLNMKAYERSEQFSGDKYRTCELLLTNQGRWYQILYYTPTYLRNPSTTNLPAMFLRYLKSFKPNP